VEPDIKSTGKPIYPIVVASSSFVDIVLRMRFSERSTEIRTRYREILGCALVGSLSILLLDTLIFCFGVFYYSDNILVLYPIAVHSLVASLTAGIRPIEYFIILTANNLYLPLWFIVSLLCTVGATILSALTCELVFERELPKAGWWILGLANPLLFYVTSQAGVVSQALSNLLFAGAILAFVCEFRQLAGRPLFGWRADRVSVFLNLMAAAMFFTKETVVAAGIVLPAATALLRLKARRLSPIFLFSLILPIVAAGCWFLLKTKFSQVPTPMGGGRYDLKLNPIGWVQNLIVTLAFPVTPLPTSFMNFDLLRLLWVVVALGSVIIFGGLLLRETLRQPKIGLPLFVVAASLAPMILIRSSELYASMIAPFAVSIVLVFGLAKMRYLSLAYGLLLYAASFGNAIIYCLGADFNLFGLQHFQYSIYGDGYQYYPICPIGTTVHVEWDGTAATEDPFHHVKGAMICTR
jgi:hypothetical protein